MKCLACPTVIFEGDRYCSETCASIADLELKAVQEIREVPNREPAFHRPTPLPVAGETLWEMVTRVSRESAVQTLTESLLEAILATDGLDRGDYITRTARALRKAISHV